MLSLDVKVKRWTFDVEPAAGALRILQSFVTSAVEGGPAARRLEACDGCRGYLKTMDVASLTPFPLIAIGDLETMEIDMAAMERGYRRPPLREFSVK